MDKPNIQPNPTSGNMNTNANVNVTTNTNQQSTTVRTSSITKPANISDNIQIGRINFKVAQEILDAKKHFSVKYWNDNIVYLATFNTQVSVSYKQAVEQINYAGS